MWLYLIPTALFLLSRGSAPARTPKGPPMKRVLSWVPLMREANAAVGNVVPLSIAAAILENESGGNPNARGPTNDAGLWQFIPSTARAYGLTLDERFNPRKATFAAFRLLRDLLKRWRGQERYAIASYNAGAGAVQRSFPGVPNPRYVKHIEEKRAKYRFLDQ